MLHCTYINTHAGFFVELLAVQINVRGNVLESHQALKKVTVYCTSLHSCLTAWFFPNAAVSTTRSISRNLCKGQFILFTLYSWSELCNCCQLSCNYAKPYRRQAGSWQQMEETESKRRRQRRHCWWDGGTPMEAGPLRGATLSCPWLSQVHLLIYARCILISHLSCLQFV